MKGLIYKDFISLHGKKQLIRLFILLIIMLILRLALPGTDSTPFIETELGSGASESPFATRGAFNDALLCPLFIVISLVLAGLIPQLSLNLIKADERAKMKNFTAALPLSKNAYIISRYVFTLLIALTMLVFSYIGILIFISGTIKGHNEYRIMKLLAEYIPVIISFILIITGLELPFFIIFGSETGSTIKIAIILFIVYILAGYMFFGNIEGLDELSFENILLFIARHEKMLKRLKYLIPVADIALYILSYIICSKVYSQKKD